MTSLPSTVLSTVSGSQFTGILPPPDLRKIIDRTSQLVCKSGAAIELKLREREKTNPKFAFLSDNDPFSAYYQWKLGREKAGDPILVNTANGSSMKTAAESAAGMPVVSNGSDIEISTAHRSHDAPQPPPELEFELTYPRLMPVDLDIIKLTALSTAQAGQSLALAIRTSELNNPQFDFLKPNHSLFGFFNSLVLQYEKVIAFRAAATAGGSSQRKWTKVKEDIIEDAQQRATWNRTELDAEKKISEEKERKRIEFASIDWSDFHVVETIDFTPEDDHTRFPQPITIDDLLNVSLQQKRNAFLIQDPVKDSSAAAKSGQGMPQEVGNAEMEMEVDSDDEDEQKNIPDQQLQNGMAISTNESAKVTAPTSQNLPANIKIRKDYQPKTMAQLNAPKVAMGISPAGQQVPLDQASKQVRVEGLDSRWKKQQEDRDSKKASSQLIPEGATPFGTLRQIVNARPDLSGSSEAEIRRKQEAEEKERLHKEREIKGWDGHADSRSSTLAKYAATGEAIDEQIAVMHARLGLTGDQKTPIGPNISGTANDSSQQSDSHLPAKPRAFLDIGGNSAIISKPALDSAPTMRNEPAMHPSRLQVMNNGGVMHQVDSPPAPVPMHTRSAELLGPGDTSAEPDAKRQKVMRSADGMLLPEANWIMMHPYPITIQVRMPTSSEKPEWKYIGQVLEVPGVKLEYTVSTLRDLIGKHHEGSNAPNSRTKLTFNGSALKNSATLASVNMQEGDVVVMSVTAAKKK